jgi:hypothetical protein
MVRENSLVSAIIHLVVKRLQGPPSGRLEVRWCSFEDRYRKALLFLVTRKKSDVKEASATVYLSPGEKIIPKPRTTKRIPAPRFM